MFKWWRDRQLAKAHARTHAEAAFTAQAALYIRPPVLNPAAHEHHEFAKWRAEHIERWLADPTNADEPFEKRNHLEAERDMYLSLLRRVGHDV